MSSHDEATVLTEKDDEEEYYLKRVKHLKERKKALAVKKQNAKNRRERLAKLNRDKDEIRKRFEQEMKSIDAKIELEQFKRLRQLEALEAMRVKWDKRAEKKKKEEDDALAKRLGYDEEKDEKEMLVLKRSIRVRRKAQAGGGYLPASVS